MIRGQHAYVVVAVVETLLDGRDEWLNDLSLLQLAKEPQCRSAHELVGVLEILQVSSRSAAMSTTRFCARHERKCLNSVPCGMHRTRE